ncbi:hypothetical protein AB0H82_07965 [Streptomyces sp. NPDC050732]|uniref:hypothetical protein n=1 Tax=Streptomyces sp. NPDC050732 TaxID=3154632 RepID=UPI0034232E4E
MRLTLWTGAARHTLCRVASAAALVSLVAALFMCLGPVAPDGGGHRGAGHTTAITEATDVTETSTVAGVPSFDDRVPRVKDADCPPDERHCAPAAHDVRAVLSPGGPSLPAFDRPAPYPQALSVPGPAVEQPSDRGSPDLHMLQVQRT